MMANPTLADVFGVSDLKKKAGDLFSDRDLKATAERTHAENVAEVGKHVRGLVAPAMDQLLDMPVADILVGGWLKIRALHDYAEGAKADSGKTFKFPLTKHSIKSKHSPKIELMLHDTKLAEVTVDIVLAFTVAKTDLMIRKGKIRQVKISGCRATGEMSCLGQTIVKRQSRKVPIATINLGKGIRIPR